MNVDTKWTQQQVTHVHWWTDNLLSFRLSRPADYHFVPGQYSRLGLPDENDQLIWRAYSVVSAPRETELEYYGVLVPGGSFTTLLKRIAVGQSMLLERAVFGFMTPDRFTDGESLWMMATGTGLGPYVSILRDGGIWKQFRHVVVVHGARHGLELAYTDELRAMQKEIGPALRVVQALTREPAGAAFPEGVLNGRLTSLLESGELEQAAGLPLIAESARVMLCGNPEMITEMRGLLHKRGMKPVRRVNPGQFLTENYW